MRLQDVVDASRAIRATRSRLAKVAVLEALLSEAGEAHIGTVVSWLSGELPQGRIGVGWAGLRKVSDTPPADSSSLTVDGLHDLFDTLKGTSGKGSNARRSELLTDMLSRATPEEQRFLVHLLLGELRQGAQQGVMAEGIAAAAGVPGDLVRRAVMFSGDIGGTARIALRDGEAGLAAIDLEIGRPIHPMLAQTSEDAATAVAELGRVIVDHKLDGARVQAHRDENGVRIFTRHLREVGDAVPEVVEAVAALDVRSIVLDGEALSVRPDGRPLPFQVTMRRFGRKLDIAKLRAKQPIAPFFFDVLHLDGRTLTDASLEERLAVLDAVIPASQRTPRLVTDRPEEAEAFFADALKMGHEGVMVKDPGSPYAAGSRGSAWRKVKPAHTLDLVVLAAEWGSGRRQGWLSNLHLGARDPAGGWVMLGKTFKGLTDALLTWQTEALLARETHREGHVVHVRRELVVEIAFNDVQESPRYPGGLALRFARVKAYREDKSPAEADTIDTVRAIHRRATR